jgi:hypothetical protein
MALFVAVVATLFQRYSGHARNIRAGWWAFLPLAAMADRAGSTSAISPFHGPYREMHGTQGRHGANSEHSAILLELFPSATRSG